MQKNAQILYESQFSKEERGFESLRTMAIYFYWGEDDFALHKAVDKLRESVIDPQWASFNYDKIAAERPEGVIEGLNQAMTPPFGAQRRLVWLCDTTVCQQCSEALLAQLDSTFSALPDTSVVLLTTRNKPDGRLKSTKLLQKHAEIKEFSLIPPWKEDLLAQQVKQAAFDLGVKLTPEGIDLLVDAVGNDTRLQDSELRKLQLYADSTQKTLSAEVVAALVTANTQNSFKLADAIREGDTGRALALVEDLIARNEPPLVIAATIIGRFRTWLWVKLMTAEGIRDEMAIAKAAEVPNPKRVYILLKEVQSISLHQLQKTLPILLDLEVSLKQGSAAKTTLIAKVIELCQILRTVRRP
jgi:DNA polymerase-3 subunit delta